MNPEKRHAIFSTLRQSSPEPRTELHYRTAYQLLVAVVLSAQATDLSVNKATKTLFTLAPTPQKMFRLGLMGVTEQIRTIGLFRTKAKNVIALSEIILNQHAGKVPNTLSALQALPGVGRKTASVVLNVAFGQPTIAVDTHIFRVANRTNLAAGASVDVVQNRLEKLVPNEFKLHAHHWLILHGRYVCVARTPRCYACGISDWCEFKKKTPAPVAPPVRRGPRAL